MNFTGYSEMKMLALAKLYNLGYLAPIFVKVAHDEQNSI